MTPHLRSERIVDHGRYLSPEPMLQDPNYVRSMALEGLSVPTYAYANNNPIRNIDPDGKCFFLAGADAIACLAALEAMGAALSGAALGTAALGMAACIGTDCLGPGALSPSPSSVMPSNIPSGAEGGSGSDNGCAAAAGAGATVVAMASGARTRKCENLMAVDSDACKELTGDSQRVARCYKSMNDRHAACLAGQRIPQLVTW